MKQIQRRKAKGRVELPTIRSEAQTASQRTKLTDDNLLYHSLLGWEVATGFGAFVRNRSFRKVDGLATWPGNFTTQFVATHGIFPASSRLKWWDVSARDVRPS
jgi:hypothetical protein